MAHVHFIGIGGTGLSAIATVLLQQGYTVSGSDMASSPATARLVELGATVFIGHRPENLGGRVETVVVSSAIPPENPEWVAARQRGVPALKRADFLGRLTQDKVGIALAGTHGKTTTTAMTAFVLKEAGQDPTYIIGGYVPQLETNAAAGSGRAFVIEADEYDHMFLGLRPQVAVLTVVEWDHPDIFPTPQALRQAFEDFVNLVPEDGLVIGCGDEPGVREVMGRTKAGRVSYGLQPDNDWQAVELQPNRQGGYAFKVGRKGQAGPPELAVSLAIPGRHNVLNGLAALIVADHQGVELAQAAEILGRFTGVGRRFELKGEVNGITVIDDYAHHPTEIRATLAAARTRYGTRPIWAVFQPHTFSRTVALLDDFAAAFEGADQVIVVDIFPSREKDDGRVHSRDLVERMAHSGARYIGSLEETTAYLVDHLSPPAVLLTLGAGDGYQIGEWVLDRLRG
jgi:UDP-N-acetylmuramate--alanine ligase